MYIFTSLVFVSVHQSYQLVFIGMVKRRREEEAAESSKTTEKNQESEVSIADVRVPENVTCEGMEWQAGVPCDVLEDDVDSQRLHQPQ